VEALKRVHLNSLEEAQLENARLREALDDRTREADAMANKFSKQRTQLEDTVAFLRRDCEGYRNKIVETEQLGSMELGELRDKLQAYHEAELDDVREKQLMQVHAFEEELSRLESINHGKNIEIEQLIKDKVATRGIFDGELLRTRDEYAALLQRHKDLELKYADLNTQSNNRLADREKHIEYLEEVVRTQKSNHESESLSLQKLIETLKQELSNEKLIFRENEQRFREELARAGNELGEAKTQGELQRAELERQVGDLRGELNGTSQSLNSRADALTTKNRMVERENEGLKNNITVKEKEIRNLVERLKASSDRETRLEVEIDELRSKIIKREQKANETVGDQKTRL
jgi:chromosome segregation ATPase